MSGGAVWVNPVEGMITSSFGTRANPVKDVQEFHDGVDIAVPEKTEALAVFSGTVTETGRSPTYGNYIKIRSDDNVYVAMYAHLSAVNVRTGEKIARGGVAALTGSTGLSTGPHLHYSLWTNGVRSDPMPDLRGLAYTAEVAKEYADRGAVISSAQKPTSY